MNLGPEVGDSAPFHNLRLCHRLRKLRFVPYYHIAGFLPQFLHLEELEISLPPLFSEAREDITIAPRSLPNVWRLKILGGGREDEDGTLAFIAACPRVIHLDVNLTGNSLRQGFLDQVLKMIFPAFDRLDK
jgi:hypothetical protein